MGAVERLLVGERASPDLFHAAGEMCRAIEANGDIHAPAAYRQQLAAVLSRRALELAHRRARPFTAPPGEAAA
jgi:carbon-monoxide dehydrogenase medium subunit